MFFCCASCAADARRPASAAELVDHAGRAPRRAVRPADVVRASKRLSWVLRHAPGSVGLPWTTRAGSTSPTCSPPSPPGMPYPRPAGRRRRANDKRGSPSTRRDPDPGQPGPQPPGRPRLRRRAAPGRALPRHVDRFLPAVLQRGSGPGAGTRSTSARTSARRRAVGGAGGGPSSCGSTRRRWRPTAPVFTRSANGVWLVASVPPRHLPSDRADRSVTAWPRSPSAAG